MADNRLFVATKPTRLQSSVVIGQTTATVGEIKDREGNTLTMADFGTEGYGVVNPNKTDEEHFVFTGITGSQFTGVSNVIMKSPYTRTSGFLTGHASGVRVIIYSNTPAAWDSFANKENDETIAETWTFTGTNLPRVDSYIAPTLDEEFATKKYIDDVAIAGSPDMTTTVKGIAEEATQAEIDADTGAGGTAARLAVNPSTLATSKYGTRLPSADEKAALAGTAGSPSASNLYLTEEDNDRLAIFAESSDGSDSYTATTTPAITSTNGTVVYLTVDTANTGSCSFDLNGEGSAQITYGNGTAPPTGSIKASDTLHLVKSGTRWVLQTQPKALVDGSNADGFHTHSPLSFRVPIALGLGAGAPDEPERCQASSAIGDNSDIYVGVMTGTSPNRIVRIFRYTKDSNTGQYYYSGTSASLTESGSQEVEGDGFGIAVGSGFVWVTTGQTTGGNDIQIHRFARDLTGQTKMTISGTALSPNDVGFAAGDDSILYVENTSTNETVSVYTISGTTATRGSDFTTTGSDGQDKLGFWYDGTDLVWMDASQTDHELQRWNVSGTQQATITRQLFGGGSSNFLAANDDPILGVPCGIAHHATISGTDTIYIMGWFHRTDQTSNQGSYLLGVAVSKP